MPRFCITIPVGVLTAVALAAAGGGAVEQGGTFISGKRDGLPSNGFNDDFFVENVAPVFARKCLACHNSEDARGGFSVEDADAVLDADVIEAGRPEDSLLLTLVTPHEGRAAEMPQNGPALTHDEVEAVAKWIADGANWPDGFTISLDRAIDFEWWSLVPATRPEVPAFPDETGTSWVRTPVDAFILRNLRDNGLSPAVEADRSTLIRRLSYDLTGLPPTFEETVAFVEDPAPDAYQRLVERLLASPQYGEHWARHWLDVVKYADTCGYDKDKLRENAWPYRDYVIRSLNEDKPYRRFVQEQVAGDVLFPEEPDGILGLGFIAAGPWDFIGHVEVPEEKIDGMVARNLDRDDMVTNVLNTFCSVTIQCARCHDHKFDPITQEHYYGLQAVFAAIDRADRVYDQDPQIESRRSRLRSAIAEYEDEIEEVNRQLKVAGGERISRLEERIATLETNGEKQPEFGYHSAIATVPDEEKHVWLSFEQPEEISKVVLRPCHDDFNNIGAGFGFPRRFKIELDGRIVIDRTAEDFPNPGLEPVEFEIDGSGSTLQITATKLAERSGDFNFALAEVHVIDDSGRNIAMNAEVESADSIEMLPRWSISNLTDGVWYEDSGPELELARRELATYELELVGAERLRERAAFIERLVESRAELDELPEGMLVYAASTEFEPEGSFKATGGVPRQIRLLKRGNVTEPSEIMLPGALPFREDETWEFELPVDATEGERRAELARWLVRDEHPLTWRSIVNRVWHYHFGNGIVDTPNDFGRMGGERSHPELLDWLAVEFHDGGGSLKDLHRLIVLSSTYRQAAENIPVQARAREIDSGNRLLWRMNRRRLTAEEIRDTILQVSGRLNPQAGGPGYYLFELEKTEHSPHFEYHKFDHTDSDSYRRSIYRFVVRSQPDPYMMTLDCADSSQSTPARTETQTPLQALTMLNSDFNLVMSAALAARVQQRGYHELRDEVAATVELVFGRSPGEAEIELLVPYAREHGLANLARVLFNTSEFVFVE